MKMAKQTNNNLITGTGRRKTAIAQVFLYEKKGESTINGKAVDTYFAKEKESLNWLKPFYVLGISHPTSTYSMSIKVKGSGPSAQVGAIVHSISNALAKLSEENRKMLRKAGLLTRDPRMVERKKYFFRKARKKPQYSKR